MAANQSNQDTHRDPGWLEKPSTVTGLVRVLWVLCIAVVAADLVYTGHPHFPYTGWFGFHAVFGFLAYCFVVFTAKGLRRLAARDEDYYRDDAPVTPDSSAREHQDDD